MCQISMLPEEYAIGSEQFFSFSPLFHPVSFSWLVRGVGGMEWCGGVTFRGKSFFFFRCVGGRKGEGGKHEWKNDGAGLSE